MLLGDRVAIVSGVGPGLGRHVALALAREGAHVVLAARTAARLEEVAAEVQSAGRRALCIPTDIASREQCERLAAAAQQGFGRIDVLVHNAFRGGPEPPAAEADLEDWRKTFEINVFGSMLLTQAVVPHMREAGGGSIVFVNSMSMRVIQPGFGGYAASKGALMVVAQTLAKELGPYRIRVNSVVPGYIWAPPSATSSSWRAVGESPRARSTTRSRPPQRSATSRAPPRSPMPSCFSLLTCRGQSPGRPWT